MGVEFFRSRAFPKLIPGAILLACLLWGFCGPRSERPRQSEITARVHGKGELSAGAGRTALSLVSSVARAGYPPPRPTAQGQDTPLMARALVLRVGQIAIGLVSLDLLEVSQELSEAIETRARELGVQATLVAATHVHSSLGGCDRNLAAQIAALGQFDRDQEREVIDRAVEALSIAAGNLQPATARWGSRPLSGLNRNRAEPDGPIDRDLRVLAFDSLPSGARLATIFSFDAHPTLVARRSARLDADFPGRGAALIEARDGGTALFFQGAAGDAGATPPEVESLSKSEAMAARLAEEVAQALEHAATLPLSEASLARARIALPHAQPPSTVPRLLSRPAAKILEAVLMDRADLTLLRLGPLTLFAVPGEPTFFVGQTLREAFAHAQNAPLLFIGLAHGYVGYVESAQRRAEGRGESRRALWDADLEARVTEGFELLLNEMNKATAPAT